ncbi:MAG: AAA family ATPase [Planctomycetia bacterium]|nr:AAA family ATPase [Planctomycetia bacterium]
MYHAYWGLGESPFRGNLDPRFFHQGPTQEEALARLHFLVEQSRTVGLLLGEPGSGKSQLLEIFAQQLGHVNRQSALVELVGASTHEFLWLLTARLGIETPHEPRPFQLWRALADHISANRYQRIATVLLLDDADEAHPEVIDQIARLAQLETSHESPLTIVLTAQPRRLSRLGTRLLELAELRIDLEGWEADDTATFVKNAMSQAGRSTPIFSETALRHLHELASGIPRRVKQLADLALLAGAGQNLVQIESETIDSVFQELGVITTENPATTVVRK